jgi:N-acetylmuramoyl-L-alanine amidase
MPAPGRRQVRGLLIAILVLIGLACQRPDASSAPSPAPAGTVAIGVPAASPTLSAGTGPAEVRPATSPPASPAAVVAAPPTSITASASAASPAPGSAPLAVASPRAGASPAVSPSPAPGFAPSPVASPAALPSPASGVAATGELPGPPPRGPTPGPTTSAPAPPAGPRVRTIALDPGHGGPEPGAVSGPYGLNEADLNLDIALRLAELLRASGYAAVLTRDSDRAVDPSYKGGGYAGGVGRDLQARIDIANGAGADLFLSIHNNGSANTAMSGTEVWYSAQRHFSDRNRALAEIALDTLVGAIREAGYPTVRRGLNEDTNFRTFQGRIFNIYVLGPGDNEFRPHVPSQMPGVLGETLFLSNPGDAAALSRPDIRQAIARGYLATVERYFDRFPE